jgi:hypothetical protein
MFAPLVADKDTSTAPVQEGPEGQREALDTGAYAELASAVLM